MNYNHLYKYKNIYHLYKAVDNTWHVESYPIVYMNDTYIYYRVPGSKNLKYKVNNSFYNEWRMTFDKEAKDKLKRDYETYFMNHRREWKFSFDGGYYLNIDANDAKDFCKVLIKPDSRTALLLELAQCKTWLEQYGAYEQLVQTKKQRVQELEEQLRDVEGTEL